MSDGSPGAALAGASSTARRARVRAAREVKPRHEAFEALGHVWERERGVRVPERQALTVFLAGAECPFTCLFCDLWRHTLDGPTPPGALPEQLRGALAAAGPIPPQAAIKLYNASNFFDVRAVPPADDAALADLCEPFARVTVESHPAFLGARCEAFAGRLEGRLEVALGLETVHPEVFPRLKDGMTLDDFDAAVEWSVARGIGVRVFVLVGLPWIPAAEFAAWAARSARHALERGADRVSLVPLRADSGSLAELVRERVLEPVTLSHLEAALRLSLERTRGRGIVEADLWDAERFARCAACREARIERLGRMNGTQATERPVGCACDDAPPDEAAGRA